MSNETPPRIATGTAAFRRMSLALFLGGFSTFSLLYCVQPLLPEFARTFGVSPAESALALSLTTAALAPAIMASGALSQAIGRRGLMFASMAGAALLNLIAAWSPGWNLLLAARALEGVVLGGVPAVAMAYIGEEMETRDLGAAMGLYVAGTAFGGMVGRVGVGVLTEFGSWRAAMGAVGAMGLVAALAFVLLLPPSRNFGRREGLQAGFHLEAWSGHLRNPSLLKLFGVGFVLMAVFVTLFNYTGFRLEAAPYGLTQTQASLIFLVYGFGMVSSSMTGWLAARFGWRIPLIAGIAAMAAGVMLTLFAPLAFIVAGAAFVSIGFFVAHSVASGWVGRLAGGAKGHAAALYLLFYYVGSSLVGSAGGWFWQHGGWPGVAALCLGLALGGGLLGLSISEKPSAR